MKTNKYLSIFASVVLLGAGMITSSCADDLDLYDTDAPADDTFWKTVSQFENNIIAQMNMWRGNYDANYMFGAGDMRGGQYEGGNDFLDGSTLDNSAYISNNLSEAQYQFTNFMNYYGFISNCNLWIYRAEEKEDLFEGNEKELSYLRGMVYGLRAMAYFQLHKMYGTCPLRLIPDVALGNYNEKELYMPRAAASEVLAQIKSDVNYSLECFAKASGFTHSVFTASNSVYYWNEMASHMLAGEVYMWSAKVSTGDYNCNTNAANDIATAKTHFETVVNSGKYALQENYYDIWRTKANSEVIFATYYDRQETTWGYPWPFLYSNTTGQAKGAYWWMVGDPALNEDFMASSSVGPDVLAPLTTTATRFAYRADATTFTALSKVVPNYVNREQVKNALVYQFDDNDFRSRMFIKAYLVDSTDMKNKVYEIKDFDTKTAIFAGAFLYKFPGQNGANSPYTIVGGNDVIYYRLPLAYAYLAEIANYQGQSADVAKYINLIRARAYRDEWNEATYGFTPGSFLENEVAILQEKTKEFLLEGQRWYDLRRLTAVKGGEAKDHLVFRPEGCVGYGLVRENFPTPYWNEVSSSLARAMADDNQIETDVPVLDYDTQSYMVLWPINIAVLQADSQLTQTEGYQTAIIR
ncbi:MAG: RagB/SusD family nutrient uptake outer membrane protein [Bacteroidales bacterium]|nr:RagB/SusD family nutrient uptake outer membrane protein [Bacteroidales bacterium]